MSSPDGPAGPEARVREEAIAWLTRLQASDTASDHPAFLDWYSADPRHAEIYDALLDTWALMGAAADTPAGKAKRDGVGHNRTSIYAVALVAAVLLALGLSAFILREKSMAGGQQGVRAERASRPGEIVSFALSDGSRITLDTNSAVTIAYSRTQRQIVLTRGRARFDVAHDSTRSFIVRAGSVDIIAHGTLFDIDLHAQGPLVSLLRGSIEIRSRRHPDRRRFLKPGQRMAMASDAMSQAPDAVPVADSRWPSGMLSFTDTPLADVIAAANRYAVHKIVLDGTDLGALRFTGTVRASDTARLANLLAQTFALVADRRDGGPYLLRHPTAQK
ncbi:pyoverdine signaling pathway anti-sigma factor FpvR [soil metagenome]